MDSVSEYLTRLAEVSGRWLAVGAVAMIVVAGLGSAVVPLFFGGGGSAYETPSGLYVETSVDHGVGAGNPFTGTDSVSVNNVSFSASGEANVTVDTFEGAWTNVSSTDASTAAVTVDPNDKQSVTISNQDAVDLSFRAIEDPRSIRGLVDRAVSNSDGLTGDSQRGPPIPGDLTQWQQVRDEIRAIRAALKK
jgi:hypothetical protein